MGSEHKIKFLQELRIVKVGAHEFILVNLDDERGGTMGGGIGWC